MRHFLLRLVFVGCLMPLLAPPAASAQSVASARPAQLALLLDIDWNQLYYLLLSHGISPSEANQIVMQAQRDAGVPPVGCTSSPENATALLGLLASAGLLGGFAVSSARGRRSRRLVPACNLHDASTRA